MIFPPSTASDIRVILFDCDGVLCPPMRFADRLAREHHITRDMTADFFRVSFLRALLGQVDVLELLPPHLAQWGWQHSAKRFVEIWLDSEKEIRPEVANAVAALRQAGYCVGLATNQERRRAHYLRTTMGCDEIFHQCFISSELGYMKPQAEYFQEVTKRLDVAPRQIIFIDDQQDYLNAASAHGWQTVLFKDAHTLARRLETILSCSG